MLVFERLLLPQVSKTWRVRKGTRRRLSQWQRRLMRQSVTNAAERRGLLVASIRRIPARIVRGVGCVASESAMSSPAYTVDTPPMQMSMLRSISAFAIRCYGSVGRCQPALKPCRPLRASCRLRATVAD